MTLISSPQQKPIPPSSQWTVTSAKLVAVCADTVMDLVSMVVSWSAQTAEGEPCGYGEITYRREGEVSFVDTETLSKAFAKKVLVKLIDSARTEADVAEIIETTAEPKDAC